MIKFYKYEGAGNDFVMINNLDGTLKLESSEIARICDRHFGIGADGLILLEQSSKADCFMNYYNSDGTIAQMCGNGARCTAKFFLEQSKARPYSVKEINLDTRAGIKNIKINNDDTYSVDMGIPNFESPDFPTSPTGGLNIEGFEFNCVSMGNPHAVTIVDDLDRIDIKDIGPKVENNSLFPNKINVEFIEKVNDDYYKVKVWERGCGATLACGTGACAVFAVINKNLQARPVGLETILQFPGGKLFLSENEQSHVILRGPAKFVFQGEINT